MENNNTNNIKFYNIFDDEFLKEKDIALQPIILSDKINSDDDETASNESKSKKNKVKKKNKQKSFSNKEIIKAQNKNNNDNNVISCFNPDKSENETNKTHKTKRNSKRQKSYTSYGSNIIIVQSKLDDNEEEDKKEPIMDEIKKIMNKQKRVNRGKSSKRRKK